MGTNNNNRTIVASLLPLSLAMYMYVLTLVRTYQVKLFLQTCKIYFCKIPESVFHFTTYYVLTNVDTLPSAVDFIELRVKAMATLRKVALKAFKVHDTVGTSGEAGLSEGAGGAAPKVPTVPPKENTKIVSYAILGPDLKLQLPKVELVKRGPNHALTKTLS